MRHKIKQVAFLSIFVLVGLSLVTFGLPYDTLMTGARAQYTDDAILTTLDPEQIEAIAEIAGVTLTPEQAATLAEIPLVQAVAAGVVSPAVANAIVSAIARFPSLVAISYTGGDPTQLTLFLTDRTSQTGFGLSGSGEASVVVNGETVGTFSPRVIADQLVETVSDTSDTPVDETDADPFENIADAVAFSIELTEDFDLDVTLLESSDGAGEVQFTVEVKGEDGESVTAMTLTIIEVDDGENIIAVAPFEEPDGDEAILSGE